MDYLTRKIINHLSSRDGRGLTDAETRFLVASSRDQTRQTATCDVDRMEMLLRHEPELLKAVGPAALHAAVQFRGTEAAVRFLLEKKVRSFDLGPGQESPLFAAVRNDNVEALRLVLEAKVGDAAVVEEQVNAEGQSNLSLLYWAANLGLSPEIVELLLKHGADAAVSPVGNGERGTTVLQEAVAHPLGSGGVPGLDPVWVWRKHEVARVLIEHGTPYDIYSAAGLDDLPRVRKLVTGDAEALSRPGEGGMTPLHWAARNNAGKVTSWLLKRKVDPDEVNLAQRTAMHQAADWNHTDMLWLLAGAGADVDAPDTSGRTPLHRAMFLGRVEAAEVLILLEADTRTGDLSGRTPLDITRQGCLFLQRGR